MKKHIDIYVNKGWERNKEREKNYPNESDPMYWDYIDYMEKFSKHPRLVNLKQSLNI